MRSPQAAAPADFRLWLHAFGFLLTAVLGGSALYGPGAATVLHDLAYVFFTALIIHRIGLCLIGLARPARRFDPPQDASGRDAQAPLPPYTLLIALRHEVAAAAGLVAALRRIDYPKDRLTVLALVEADDPETAAAVEAASLPEWIRVVIVPPGQPRTKARALNYGLTLTRSHFVAVYDAEDIPHPQQLAAAVSAFAAHPDLACVQAPLVIHNGRAGWLASQFDLEYAVHFGQLVPGMVALNLPVPLGGTSNHFRTSVLRALGGWDPFNVTEDAELGIRLACQGYRVGHIAPPTLEEAPERAGVWLAQRSRWLKGYAQTCAAHMVQTVAHPACLPVWAHLHVWLMLSGTALAAAVHGPLILIALVAAGFGHELALADLGLLGAGYLAGVLGHAMALAQRDRLALRGVIAALSLPLYWPLQSVALVRALWGLARNPAYWAKTPHAAHPAALHPAGGSGKALDGLSSLQQ